MTLIINEIHLRKGLSETFQIASADRRIMREKKVLPPKQKLFPIKHINSTISYFGLASFYTKSGKEISLEDFLKDFIRKSSWLKDVESFAINLSETLNEEMPNANRRACHSGFHISCYHPNGLPDFYYFSNIKGMNETEYFGFMDTYTVPSSHFLKADAINHYKWDGINPLSAIGPGRIYRNGDIRTHAIVSESLDNSMKQILEFQDFKKIKSKEEYADYVKFKFEFISYLYKNWANQKVISRPIDVFILTKDGILEKKKSKWKYIN